MRFRASLLALFLALAAMPAQALITRYVNTASLAGGDGTTNNVLGPTRAYSGLVEFEADEAVDLPGIGDSMTVFCSVGSTGTLADGFDGKLSIAGWTMDSASSLTIEAAAADDHGGVYNTSVYRLEVATDDCIETSEDFIVLRGLQLFVTSTNGGDNPLVVITAGASNRIFAERCIIRGSDDDGTAQRCVLVNDATADVTLRNCLLYDAGQNASTRCFFANQAGAVLLQNLTVVNGTVGVESNTAYTGTNVLVDDSDGDAFAGTNGTLTNCAADDASSADDTDTDCRESQTFTFVGAADFHLGDADAGARDFGFDLSGTFTEDIDGETRPGGAAWDIGSDEVFPAGALPMAWNVYRRRR